MWISFASSESMYSVEMEQATVTNNVAGACFNCACQVPSVAWVDAPICMHVVMV